MQWQLQGQHRIGELMTLGHRQRMKSCSAAQDLPSEILPHGSDHDRARSLMSCFVLLVATMLGFGAKDGFQATI